MIGKAGVHDKGAFDFADILGEMRQNPIAHKAGCLVAFIGFVRGDVFSETQVVGLELEAWKNVADETLVKICQEEEQRTGALDVRIHHFIGKFGVGEDLVYVLVLAGHRQEAFDALRSAVERYKHETPIWKKECCLSGAEYWVTEEDRPFAPAHPQAKK